MHEKVQTNIRKSCWIDGLHHQVRLRKKAFGEVLSYLQSKVDKNDIEGIDYGLFNFIKKIMTLEQQDHLSDLEDLMLRDFAREELIYDDKEMVFLQVPVPSQITPKNAHQFILHYLLKYGRFETEVDLTTHASVRDSFRYAKLIGNDTDENSLKTYCNILLRKYIVEEVFEYSFSMRTKQKIIVQAHTLFQNVIVHNKIPIIDMPQTSLQAISEKEKIELESFWNLSKKEIIQTAFFELGMIFVCMNFIVNV